MADQPQDNQFFSQNQQQGDPQQNQPSPDGDLTTILASIKNEQGEQKYDNLPKALEGLANAQQYIPQLKTELQAKDQELLELRTKLEQQQSVEEVVSRLTAKQESSNTPPSTPPEPAVGLDEQAVLNLFQQFSQQQSAESIATQNAEQVQTALQAKFGDKAQEAMRTKASELNMSPEALGALAKQSPQAALALFGAGGGSPQPNTSSIQTSLHTPEPEALQRPEKSVLSGATSKEQKEFMEKVKAEVYRKYDVKV